MILSLGITDHQNTLQWIYGLACAWTTGECADNGGSIDSENQTIMFTATELRPGDGTIPRYEGRSDSNVVINGTLHFQPKIP